MFNNKSVIFCFLFFLFFSAFAFADTNVSVDINTPEIVNFRTNINSSSANVFVNGNIADVDDNYNNRGEIINIIGDLLRDWTGQNPARFNTLSDNEVRTLSFFNDFASIIVESVYQQRIRPLEFDLLLQDEMNRVTQQELDYLRVANGLNVSEYSVECRAGLNLLFDGVISSFECDNRGEMVKWDIADFDRGLAVSVKGVDQ